MCNNIPAGIESEVSMRQISSSCWLIFLCSIVFSFTANALTGEDAVRSKSSDFPFICKIEISEPNSSSEYNLCSGTLIAPNRIVSAAHCFSENFLLKAKRVDVECGGVRMGKVADIRVPKVWNYDSTFDRKFPRTDEDLADLTLANNSELPTLPVAKAMDEIFSSDPVDLDRGMKLKDGIRCYIAGYGTNSNEQVGTLYTAPLKSEEIYWKGFITFTGEKGKELRNTVQLGDSGGPLICEGEHFPKTLVGVIVESIARRKQAPQLWFAPAWNLKND